MPANTRQFVLGAVAVLLAGVVVLRYFTRSPAVPAPTGNITLDGICLACQQDVVVSYKVGEVQRPLVCPLCGKRAVYGAFYCPQCKLRVVCNLVPGAEGGPAREPMVPTCLVCGGPLMGFIREDPEHAQTQRGPLRDWPP